jgi:NADH:ubiquinone oxidoreductase subunit 3 (subunit A)
MVTVLTLVGPYGFWVFITFAFVLTVGFAIELASGALAFTKQA